MLALVTNMLKYTPVNLPFPDIVTLRLTTDSHILAQIHLQDSVVQSV